MNRFFTLLLAASCLTAVGQVTYPYNPDGNADGDIAVGDLQDFLVTYGSPFSPSEIMVGDSSLTYWVEQLSQTIQEQQTLLDNLISQINSQGEAHSRSLYWPLGCFGRTIFHHHAHGPYIVPADSILMVTHGDELIYHKDDLTYAMNQSAASAIQPIPIGSGASVIPPNVDSWISGVLVPVSSGVEVFFWDFSDGPFLVPSNKIFFSRWGDDGFGGGQIQGFLDDGLPLEYTSPELGALFPPGTELFDSSGYGAVMGFLLDSNHFLSTSSSNTVDDVPSGPCQGEFTVNYHGYDYQLVEIGDQCWFAENVRFLPRKATSGANVHQGSEDNGLPYSYVYGEDSNDLDIIASSSTLAEFGALYNFQASIVWDLCPSDWHIPSDADWMTLEAFVGVPEGELTSTNWRGTAEEAGKKLKSIFWSGTDEFGFGALPGGARYALNDGWQWSGGPGSEEPYALFMTSSFMNGGEVAIAMRSVRFDEEGIWRGPLYINPTGLSVRCIKDTE